MNTALISNRLVRSNRCYIIASGQVKPIHKRTEAEKIRKPW